ncbi:hypothetical protein BKA70DRAFT_1107185 [Coprinopsis sp. MPI-PUGE-AT-0042]|nr:hypothetical protein BKA70DRAFT_1107185 [Coprinopsis sp. MPI-PUGE-AT-0042]
MKESTTAIDLSIPENSKVVGAKLSKATQSSLYRGIIGTKSEKTRPRHTTVRNLSIAKHAAKEATGLTPPDKAIWKKIRGRDVVSNKTKNFLWKALHGALKIGNYWEGMTNFEHCSRCRHCDTTETLEHILLECERSGQQVVWQMAERLMEKRGERDWNRPSWGDILSCAFAKEQDPGKRRLRSILISESAYFIWLVRCQWKIGHEEDELKFPHANEIRNRWLKHMRSKRTSELNTAKMHSQLRIHQKIDVKLIYATWKNTVLLDESPSRGRTTGFRSG